MTQVRREGTTAILELDGKLVFGEPVVEFRSRWAEAMSMGATAVILDLSRASYVDSSGIGTLVRCQAALTPQRPGGGWSPGQAGGRIKVVGVPAAVRNALKIARVDNLFDYYDTQAAALAAATATT